jgi:hypothetical protein
MGDTRLGPIAEALQQALDEAAQDGNPGLPGLSEPGATPAPEAAPPNTS